MFFNRFVPTIKRPLFVTLIAMLAVLAHIPLCHAASTKNSTVKPEVIATSPAPVIFDNKTLFIVQSKILSFSPQERARLITERIKRLAENQLLQINTIRAIDGETASDIVAGDLIIMSVTEEDAKAAEIGRAHV